MDIAGKLLAMLEIENKYITELELFSYVRDKTDCSMIEFSEVLKQLSDNGVVMRRIDGGVVLWKKSATYLLPEFLCDLCSVSCNSYSQYADHIQGHQHSVNLHAVRSGTRDRTQWYTCGVCRKRVNSPLQLMLHMSACCTTEKKGAQYCNHDFPERVGSCDCGLPKLF